MCSDGPVYRQRHGARWRRRDQRVCSRHYFESASKRHIEIQWNSGPWSIASDAEWNLYFEFRAWIQDVCSEATLYLTEKEH